MGRALRDGGGRNVYPEGMKNLVLPVAFLLSLAASAAAARHEGGVQTANPAGICDRLHEYGSPAWQACRAQFYANLRSCDIYAGTPYYEACKRALLAAADVVKQCNELPPDHPNGCRRLSLGSDIITQCHQLPADHPRGCRALLSMDVIRQCNELPPDHPNGCRRLLSDASLICGREPQLSICQRGQQLLSEADQLRASSVIKVSEAAQLRSSSVLFE